MTMDGFSIFVPKSAVEYLTSFTVKYGLYPRDVLFYLLAGVMTGTISLPTKKLSHLRKLWKDEPEHWFTISGEVLDQIIVELQEANDGHE